MKRSLVSILLLISIVSFAQKSKTLFSIDGKNVSIEEFKRVFDKNAHLVENDDNNVNDNLELYINYKLKIKEAYKLHLDTLRSYKRDIETYKNQLSAPYLQDKEFAKKLIADAYDRTKHEIRASHILVRLPRNAQPKDTLEAYNRIMKARQEILDGASFESVAKRVSNDPSAKSNGGDLGYFSAFKMVYPFEDATYSTKLNTVSKPFKTRFGYHIVKPTAIRLSKGEVETAHILITDTTATGKKKINEVYGKLNTGVVFDSLAKQYSNDRGSKLKGGKLPRFGSGRMVKPFEDNAFSLTKEGSYSKPFRTRFGWHIVKLLKKHPVKSFQEMEKELTSKVKGSGRARLSDKAVLDKLKKKYNVIVNSKARATFDRAQVRSFPIDSMQQTLLTINNKKIKQEAFQIYIRNRRHKPINVLFEMFKDKEIKAYFKENLVNTEPEYAYTLQEYKDGLLLFELMQRKVWEKSSKDSLGLKKFFEANAANYKTSDLGKIKGTVMNDYQNHLEQEWIKELKAKSNIKINKRQLKKLEKYYRKND